MSIDYRKFNIHKKQVSAEDLLDELKGAKIFSLIDLRSGYPQIRMKEGEE